MLNVCVIGLDEAIEMLCAYSHVGGGNRLYRSSQALI